MKIAKQLTELIGNTPLLELTNYEKEQDLKAKIVVKLEYFNPLGSVKDRVANAMIEQGIKDGKINQDTIIIEPTSGNTGITRVFFAFFIAFVLFPLRMVIDLIEQCTIIEIRFIGVVPSAKVIDTPQIDVQVKYV